MTVAQPSKPLTNETPIIEARGITKNFVKKLDLAGRIASRLGSDLRDETVHAVDNVDLTVAQGEVVGLVGESGCGKSTLTRALLGLEQVQGGSITLNGAPVFSGTRPNLDVRRQMQVVFQDPFGSFNPRHRVDRLITEPFHLLPDPPQGADRTRAIDEALTAVGLTHKDASKYIHEFSGGQRQRIAIARAMILKPKLVVLDEPTSALDMTVQTQIVELLRQLQSKYGLGYLFISHDLKVVRALSHKLIIMKQGRVVEAGLASRLFTRPTTEYAKALMAAAFSMEVREGVSE